MAPPHHTPRHVLYDSVKVGTTLATSCSNLRPWCRHFSEQKRRIQLRDHNCTTASLASQTFFADSHGVNACFMNFFNCLVSTSIE